MITLTASDFQLNTPSVVALGCFDGVHIGHRALIKEARRAATKKKLPLTVFSFSEPPKNFFVKGSVPLLTDKKEKKRLMASLGVDIFVCVDFSLEIASLTPEKFFEDIIISRLCAREVFCGFNYRFGKDALGDAELLSKLCREKSVGFYSIPPVLLDGLTVSSSEIRSQLTSGHVAAAAKLLGRYYSVKSEVVIGKQLGRALGFPTVNQLISKESTPLKNGVYRTRTRIGHLIKPSITNVGVRPTVDGHTLCAETNVFDFDGDLYGRNIRVEFLEFIRPEKKFDSVEQLSKQVQKDIEKAKNAK